MPKRICLFSDGSGNHPEQGVPTNIVRLAKAILPLSSDETFQQVFYDPGVGTAGGLDHEQGLYFGIGINVNIRQLYTELAMNYVPGDEVYLFGFSRGAYTVRSLASMIHVSGLVGRTGLEFVEEAFELYRSGATADSDVATVFRSEHGDRIPIKAICCFDTVGALGFPLPLPWPFSKWNEEQIAFHDVSIHEEVEHAIHAMSIDEDMAKFQVDLMKPAKGRDESQLCQLFFAGHHTGVGGGGTEEKLLSDMAARFIVDELEARGCGLEFDLDLIQGEYYDVQPRQHVANFDKLVKFFTGTKDRPVSLESMHYTAIERYLRVPGWRPNCLKGLHDAILEKAKELGFKPV